MIIANGYEDKIGVIQNIDKNDSILTIQPQYLVGRGVTIATQQLLVKTIKNLLLITISNNRRTT